MGVDSSLGVHPATVAKLFIVSCTVGPYFPEGFKAIKIYATDKAVRAFPGGLGFVKVGGNYGATLKVQLEAI